MVRDTMSQSVTTPHMSSVPARLSSLDNHLLVFERAGLRAAALLSGCAAKLFVPDANYMNGGCPCHGH
jgi:hypothetical protein